MSERIAFIVERLNGPPFRKGLSTMTEFDSKSSLELLDLVCEVVVAIDPDQESLLKDTTESRIQRITKFLLIMKFHIPEDQMDVDVASHEEVLKIVHLILGVVKLHFQ